MTNQGAVNRRRTHLSRADKVRLTVPGGFYQDARAVLVEHRLEPGPAHKLQTEATLLTFEAGWPQLAFSTDKRTLGLLQPESLPTLATVGRRASL